MKALSGVTNNPSFSFQITYIYQCSFSRPTLPKVREGCKKAVFFLLLKCKSKVKTIQYVHNTFDWENVELKQQHLTIQIFFEK